MKENDKIDLEDKEKANTNRLKTDHLGCNSTHLNR